MKQSAEAIMDQGAPMAFTINTGNKTITDPSHYHPYFELQYILKGERNIILKNDIYKIRKGDFVIYAPFTMHNAYEINKTLSSRIILYFSPQIIISDEARDMLKNSSGVYQPTPEYNDIINKMLDEIISAQANTGTLHSDYVSSLLNCLLMIILRNVPVCEHPEKQLRISQVMKYIKQHYQEDITLKDLSDRFYVSPYYLCREFKRYTNSTITQYINTVRVMNAEVALLNTNQKITEIAIESGFSSSTHFYRVFKTYSGMAPSEYREKKYQA